MKQLLLASAFLWITALTYSQPKTYTIVFLNHKPDAEKIDKETQTKLFEAHMANINRLAKEGKLLAAGPFDGGGGIFILNTNSVSEAQTWVETDPAVKANRWNIEILPYIPRVGSICPATEPYEMVKYTFVRFNAIVDKFTASSYPNLVRQHGDFLKKVSKTSEVVTEAIFGDNEGGILVVRGELPSDAFATDPGVQQGLLDVEFKKLYIAKTSFCEN